MMEGEGLEKLRETYRGLLDGELLSLAADAKSLTDVARFALQEEIGGRGLNERDVSESGRPAPEEHSEVPHRGNRSRFLSTLKKSGWVVILILYGLNRAWFRFHQSPSRWLTNASGCLILLLTVVLAMLELRQIRKKERRRKRLAIAFGLDKKN